MEGLLKWFLFMDQVCGVLWQLGYIAPGLIACAILVSVLRVMCGADVPPHVATRHPLPRRAALYAIIVVSLLMALVGAVFGLLQSTAMAVEYWQGGRQLLRPRSTIGPGMCGVGGAVLAGVLGVLTCKDLKRDL